MRLLEHYDARALVALDTLGKLDAASWLYRRAIVAQLEHSDADVRRQRRMRGRLDAASLASHTGVIVAWLEDSEAGVRYAHCVRLASWTRRLGLHLARSSRGSSTLTWPAWRRCMRSALDAASLPCTAARSLRGWRTLTVCACGVGCAWQAGRGVSGLHAGAIVARLEHYDENVRWAGSDALCELFDALGSRTPLPLACIGAIVARLEDSNANVRRSALGALGKLDAASLARHGGATVARLEHSDADVRSAALNVLRALDAASLASHGGAIVARLEDFEASVRRAALDALGRLDAASLACTAARSSRG